MPWSVHPCPYNLTPLLMQQKQTISEAKALIAFAQATVIANSDGDAVTLRKYAEALPYIHLEPVYGIQNGMHPTFFKPVYDQS